VWDSAFGVQDSGYLAPGEYTEGNASTIITRRETSEMGQRR
jgi:hypothetical protein